MLYIAIVLYFVSILLFTYSKNPLKNVTQETMWLDTEKNMGSVPDELHPHQLAKIEMLHFSFLVGSIVTQTFTNWYPCTVEFNGYMFISDSWSI